VRLNKLADGLELGFQVLDLAGSAWVSGVIRGRALLNWLPGDRWRLTPGE
jgi:hypothetical protein